MIENLIALPSNVDALHFRGVLQFQSGERKHAVVLLRKSIELDPNDPASVNNLGNMLRTTGDLDSANEMYQQAHILAPVAIDPLINLGVLARSRQEYKFAKTFYLKAL